MKEARTDAKEQIKPDPTIKPSKYDIVSEGYNPDELLSNIEKENSTMQHITESLETGWFKLINWVKKSIAMMIIFILIGGAGGLYIAKIAYNLRMNEVCKVGGFVHDNRVYDVKLRP